jgi:Predicted dithiol-disulfide isomerase involved in polyketide biosynthesis
VSDDTLAVYSEFVCPFCYLGRAALREYLADAEDPPTVEWRLFDLRGYKRDPDGGFRDVDDGKDGAYFEEVRANVAKLRERYDVEMRSFDDVPEVDSWDAQQAALFVRQAYPDSFDAFYDATMDAYWRDGRDIADPDVLATLAEDVGVSGAAVRDAITDERLAAELGDRFERAQRQGIEGIPTFVYGDHAARGAVPPAHLERLVDV